ncbi:MAG: HDOD domain-containing protein [Gammaproteobacteria bacterium]
MQTAAQTLAEVPMQIGRFQPMRLIGQGGQGAVYLARDPELDRQVAIKTLTRRSTDPTRLIAEARNAAKLHHSNIVTLLEIGTHNDLPFLVYQYVEGTPLKNLMAGRKTYTPAQAVELIINVLDGISHAHRAGVLHRDLTPSNILVDVEGRPWVLDFGISSLIGMSATGAHIVGTPNYMAPENLNGGEIGEAADVFSLAVILHELLTGFALIKADNPTTAMFKIVNETFLPPSMANPEIDAKLDEIVMRGLERDLSKRYHSAKELSDSLRHYLNPDETPRELSTNDEGNSAVDFLLRRLNRRPDFPAISQHIGDITQKTGRSDDTHANELANTVLKDYALTSKLLKLVNSTLYRHAGGAPITTISRAVMILGFEQVRQAALNLMMFEHLKNAEQADDMRNALLNSFFSAQVARDLGSKTRGVNSEEVFIAGLFLRLGKHLTIYYFAEEYAEIQRLVTNRGISETEASKEVLGATYVELGAAIAKQWHLPDMVVKGINASASSTVTTSKLPSDHALTCAIFANELAETIATGGPAVQANLDALSARYKRNLDLSHDDLKKVVNEGMDKVIEYARVLNVNARDSALCAGISKVTNKPLQAIVAAASNNNSLETTLGGSAVAPAVADDSEDAAMKRRMLLINSISEIATTVMGEYNLNNVLVMILETLYRGVGFSRVLMVVKDAKTRTMQARFGFGEGIDEIVPKFRYSIDTASDVLVDAANTGREFVVLDTSAMEYEKRIPAWCRKLTSPRALVLLPIVVNKAVVSLIYADFVAPSNRITMEEIKLFATLTKQAALAIHQKSLRK